MNLQGCCLHHCLYTDVRSAPQQSFNRTHRMLRRLCHVRRHLAHAGFKACSCCHTEASSAAAGFEEAFFTRTQRQDSPSQMTCMQMCTCNSRRASWYGRHGAPRCKVRTVLIPDAAQRFGPPTDRRERVQHIQPLRGRRTAQRFFHERNHRLVALHENARQSAKVTLS